MCAVFARGVLAMAWWVDGEGTAIPIVLKGYFSSKSCVHEVGLGNVVG